jgi:hypothetical protein
VLLYKYLCKEKKVVGGKSEITPSPAAHTDFGEPSAHQSILAVIQKIDYYAILWRVQLSNQRAMISKNSQQRERAQ